MLPDYSIYPHCDFAIGYITRGRPNHCRWCVVPEKEGNIKPYREWRELVRPDSKKMVLMDNNILASPFGVAQLESLIDSGYHIDLNQGMDARLVNNSIARIISHLNWIRYIRFSCDTIGQIESIQRTADLLQRYGVKPYKLFIYLLVTADLEDASARVEALKKIGSICIYAQAERNEKRGIFTAEFLGGKAGKNTAPKEIFLKKLNIGGTKHYVRFYSRIFRHRRNQLLPCMRSGNWHLFCGWDR